MNPLSLRQVTAGNPANHSGPRAPEALQHEPSPLSFAEGVSMPGNGPLLSLAPAADPMDLQDDRHQGQVDIEDGHPEIVGSLAAVYAFNAQRYEEDLPPYEEPPPAYIEIDPAPEPQFHLRGIALLRLDALQQAFSVAEERVSILEHVAGAAPSDRARFDAELQDARARRNQLLEAIASLQAGLQGHAGLIVG